MPAGRLGNTGEVDNPDRFLKNAIVALSIVLVLIVSVIAAVSVSGQDEQDAARTTVPDLIDAVDVADAIDPAAGERPYPGDLLEIADAEFPLAVGCLPGRGGDGQYYVVITNHGTSRTDYVVGAELRDGDGGAVAATADVPALVPGEEREVLLAPDRRLNRISSCEITAIQGRGRVLLTNR